MPELMDDFLPTPPVRPKRAPAIAVAITAVALALLTSACGGDDPDCGSTPVCGADGVTYLDRCALASAGVSARHTGACESMDAGPRDGSMPTPPPPPPPADGGAPDGATPPAPPPPVDGGTTDAATPPPPPPPGECDAMDARGEGVCGAFFGYTWDGTACVGVSGCSCVGTSCRRLLASPAECELRYGDCLSTCGGIDGVTCADDRYCDYPDDSVCGFGDVQGHCRVRPSACPRILAPVCGCDDTTYDNDCEANRAGVDWSRRGDCESTPPPPPPPPPPPGTCERQDAVGDGLCDAFFGYAWDGSGCYGISGCSCRGADCERLWGDERECAEAHRACGGDCRTTGCPAGTECQLCWVDFACIPAGAVC